MKMTFKKVEFKHKDIIFAWLDSPHVKEFWDNSQAHRDDIINFMEGRKTPAPYFKGIFDYWIGFVDDNPYCFLLTSMYKKDQKLDDTHKNNLSKTGNTFSIDFCIGNLEYLGVGLAAPTLETFCKFFQAEIDNSADTFFIDPDENNPRATRVYNKAGFEPAGTFKVDKGFFEGNQSLLMVKRLKG